MDPTLSTYQRIYIQVKRGEPGKVRMVFSRLKPTGGALVALLSRGSILSDGMEIALVSDPTQDPALRGPAGKDGTNGNDGASAYQIARSGGYGGTETQWVASLTGASGKSAYQLARDGGYGGTETQWLASLKAADGVSPVLSIGSVASLPAGAGATATLTGTPSAPKLNLGVPRGDAGVAGATLIGSVTLTESNLLSISAGVRRRVIATTFDLPAGVPLLLLPKAPPPVGYIAQAAWATKTRELTVDLTLPAITALTSYSIDCWLIRINT